MLAPPPAPPEDGLVPAEGTLGQVEAYLATLLRDFALPSLPKGPGRPPIFPAVALWAALLVCILRGFSSQLTLWRLLTDRGLWFFPRYAISDQAVYKRLASGRHSLELLFHHLTSVLQERLADRGFPGLVPFATAVFALDESTLDQVARHLPSLRGVPKGDDALLPGKIAGAFDLRSQQWRTVRFTSHPHQNERVLARDLVSSLPTGSLILADLGYFGFAWFDWLTEHGYWWVSRLRAGTSFEVLHTFYQHGETFDGLVWLGRHHRDRAAAAVRLLRYRSPAGIRSFITNVHDPHQLPLGAVPELYSRRWDIELAFLTVKRHLQLHLLWSAKQPVILEQLWGVLILAQVLQALRLEIAHHAGCDPFEVSLGLLVQYLPGYAAQGLDPLAHFVEVGPRLGFIRPSRRVQIRAPDIPPAEIVPAPPGLTLLRPPRYARKQ